MGWKSGGSSCAGWLRKTPWSWGPSRRVGPYLRSGSPRRLVHLAARQGPQLVRPYCFSTHPPRCAFLRRSECPSVTWVGHTSMPTAPTLLTIPCVQGAGINLRGPIASIFTFPTIIIFAEGYGIATAKVGLGWAGGRVGGWVGGWEAAPPLVPHACLADFPHACLHRLPPTPAYTLNSPHPQTLPACAHSANCPPPHRTAPRPHPTSASHTAGAHRGHVGRVRAQFRPPLRRAHVLPGETLRAPVLPAE